MSDKIEGTVFSSWLSGMISGIPDQTKLFLLPYCANELKIVPGLLLCFPNYHILHGVFNFYLETIDYNTFSFYNIAFWDTFMLAFGSAIMQDSKSEKF